MKYIVNTAMTISLLIITSIGIASTTYFKTKTEAAEYCPKPASLTMTHDGPGNVVANGKNSAGASFKSDPGSIQEFDSYPNMDFALNSGSYGNNGDGKIACNYTCPLLAPMSFVMRNTNK